MCNDGRVSSDFLGHKANAIIDVDSCKKVGGMYKILAWYDNEMGYSCRLIDLIEYMEQA